MNTSARAHIFLGLVSAAALSAATAGSAGATTLLASTILSDFNLVTNSDVSTNQDIEGAAVIGGNLSGATFFNNSNDLPATKVVQVYGSTITSPVHIDAGGNLDWAGTLSGQVNFNGGGSQSKTLPNPLSAYTTPLTNLSTTLEGLASSGGTIVNGTFTAPAGATGLVVFNVTAAQLYSALTNNQVKFSGGAGVTGYIINVSGNFTEPTSANFNTKQQDALFNFYNATSLTLGNWDASVLAPDAALNISNGFIDGSVYANTFTGGGELHNDNLYDGGLPGVPEPSTWAMMLLGLGGLGGVLRRIKARNQAATSLA